MFREKGFDAISVAELMRAAGLTHGGFYNHFEFKDALEAEACAQVFGNSVATMRPSRRSPTRRGAGAAFDAYWRRYVSKKARDSPAARCPMVAFAGEVSRQPAPVRDKYAAGLRQYLEAFERAGDAGDGRKGDRSRPPREAAPAGDRAVRRPGGRAGARQKRR